MRNAVCVYCMYIVMTINHQKSTIIIKHTDSTVSHAPAVSGSTVEAHTPRQEEEAPGSARSSAGVDSNNSTQC
jgi:hypothetical protein